MCVCVCVYQMSKLHLFLVTYLGLHSLALPVFGSFRFLYARRKMGRIMESPCPSVRPSTIACERDILKTACRIDFTF